MSASDVPAVPAAAPEGQVYESTPEPGGESPPPPGSPQRLLSTKFNVVPVDKGKRFRHTRSNVKWIWK